MIDSDVATLKNYTDIFGAIERLARTHHVEVLKKLFPHAERTGKQVRMRSPSVPVRPGHDSALFFDFEGWLWIDTAANIYGRELAPFLVYQSGLNILEAGRLIAHHALHAKAASTRGGAAS